MKILLINPLLKSSDMFLKLKSANNIIPPMGLLYIGSVLQKSGFEVNY